MLYDAVNTNIPKYVTLYVNETPRENSSPMKIIVGETFPPAQQTYGQISNHSKTSPYCPLTVVWMFVVGR